MKNALIFLLFSIVAQAAVPAPQPVLSISANHATVVELPKGWPLFVTGRLFHSDRLNKSVSATPLRIDSPNGASWADAIRLLVTAPDGSEKVWNLKPAGSAEHRVLEMTQRDFVTFGWTLSSADTASIPAGEYRLSARLAIQGTSGWNGEATSPAVRIKVIEQPTVLDEAKDADKAVLRARYELAAGNPLAAASVVDQFLAVYPANTRGLLMQSRILEVQGRPIHAWLAAKEALAVAYDQEPFPKEPPFSLVLREQELVNHLTIPRLAAAWTSGVLQLTVTGDRGSSYSIETSTTLANWSLALGVTLTNQNSVVVLPAPATNGEAHRFYRAVRSP